MLLTAVMVLIIGTMAAFHFFFVDGKKQSLLSAGDAFGQVNIEGVIMDSRDVNEWIAELRDDDNIKGVVIRVDSPGGGVSPSQEIHRAVKKLAQKKPVVVSMGAVAASGGYYVSCPAHTIIANPGSITGSIGVMMEMTNLMGLMDTLGIGHTSLTSGKLKDAGSPYRELSGEEKVYFDGIIKDMFDQFVTDVATGRKLDPKKVKRIADGRILTGRQALVEGLIDGLGGLEEAIEMLKKHAKVTKDLPIIEGPVEEVPWLESLLSTALKLAPVQQVQGAEWRFMYK